MKFTKLAVSILALLTLLVAFSGCSREGLETSERLVGTWTVSTFVESGAVLGIATEADILVVDSVSSFTMTYVDETTARGNVGRGSFTWDMVADGTSYVLAGTYSVTAESGRLELTFESGSWAPLYVEDPGNSLRVFGYVEDGSVITMTTTIGNFSWLIEAAK